MKVLLAGGGTGGHVYPAIAIGQELASKYGAEIAYVGNENSFESDKIGQLNWPFFSIDIQGIKRSLSIQNLLFPWKLLRSLMASKKIIRNFDPDLVVGTGGYVSGPPVYMASRMNRFTAIQEQNSFPGMTSRLLSKKVRAIYMGFADSRKYFPPEKCVLAGNPIRSDLMSVDKKKARTAFDMQEYKNVMLVFGGSQGAHSINIHLAKILDELCENKDLGIIWQTGKNDFEHFRDRFAKLSQLKILPFILNMNEAYAAADWSVTRAGALSLAELAAVAMPVILIPYPHATGDHQMHNAKSYEKEQAAYVIPDHGDYSSELKEKINELYIEPEVRTRMSAHIRRFAAPEAATIIADSLINLWEGK